MAREAIGSALPSLLTESSRQQLDNNASLNSGSFILRLSSEKRWTDGRTRKSRGGSADGFMGSCCSSMRHDY